jgi:hypothetical protein
MGTMAPDSFGEVQELRRQQRPAVGVIPAQQRLGAGHAAAVGGDDRLVGEAQLAVGERPLELGGQLLVLERDSARIASVYSSLRERPRRLAWYIAMSALRSSVERRVLAADALHVRGEASATPTLTVSSTSTPFIMILPLSARRMRSASSSAECSSMCRCTAPRTRRRRCGRRRRRGGWRARRGWPPAPAGRRRRRDRRCR